MEEAQGHRTCRYKMTTNPAIIQDIRARLERYRNGLIAFDTYIRSHPITNPAQISQQLGALSQYINIFKTEWGRLRADPPDATQHKELIRDCKNFIHALDVIKAHHAELAAAVNPLIPVVSEIEALGATAFGPQQAQQLENTEVAIVKEADAIEIELKESITEEIKDLSGMQNALNIINDMIAEMKYVEAEIITAKTHPTGATAQMALNNAKEKLQWIEKNWDAIDNQIKYHFKLDSVQEKTTSKAVSTLKNLHKKLNEEENRIRQAKAW